MRLWPWRKASHTVDHDPGRVDAEGAVDAVMAQRDEVNRLSRLLRIAVEENAISQRWVQALRRIW